MGGHLPKGMEKESTDGFGKPAFPIAGQKKGPCRGIYPPSRKWGWGGKRRRKFKDVRCRKNGGKGFSCHENRGKCSAEGKPARADGWPTEHGPANPENRKT